MSNSPSVFEMVHQVLADTDAMLLKGSAGGVEKTAEVRQEPITVDTLDLSGALKVASVCDYIADHLHNIVDDRPATEKLAEHFAIQEAIMAKMGGEEVGPAVSVEGVESALRREAADAPGESLDAGESGEATPANQPDQTIEPDEKAFPSDAATALETNREMMMADQPEDVLKQAGMGPKKEEEKTSSANVPPAFARIFAKLASDVDNPASVSGGSEPPLQSVPGVPNVQSQGSEAGELTPRKTAPTTGEGGGRELIGSNEAAINATKRDAKKSTIDALSELLSEPAMSAAHDKVLDRSLENTSSAGVKIAATKALLKKVAESGPKGQEYVASILKAAQMGAVDPQMAAQMQAQQPQAVVPVQQPVPAPAAQQPQGLGVTPEEVAAAQQLLMQQQAAQQMQQQQMQQQPAAMPPPGQMPVM